MFFKEERKKYQNNLTDVSLDEIENKLNSNDIVSVRKFIKIFLLNHDSLNYEYFIHSLIDIAQLKGNDYTEVINVLRELENGTYNFKISDILSQFYKSLIDRNISVAKIYLNMIDGARIFGYDISILGELKELINIYQAKLFNEKVDILYNKLISDGEFICIDNLNEDSLDIVLELKKMSDVKIVSLDKIDGRIIYLIYSPFKKKLINYSECINKANVLYKNGFYEESKEKYLEIIRYCTNVRKSLFIKIAVCYYKLGNYDKALDMIYFAKYFNFKSNIEQTEFDYDSFIKKIENIKMKKLNN